jgi:hypothetical protein
VKICRGTLLSRTQYSHDVGLGGYQDARQTEAPSFFAKAGEHDAAGAAREPPVAAAAQEG